MFDGTMKLIPPLLSLLLVLLLAACEPTDVREASIWVICDEMPDVCESTHSGALCTPQRADAIRYLAIQRKYPSSITAYEALKTLDRYKVCLEDAYVSEAVRNKANKQSQITTIQKIPELQKGILADSRKGARPEVNLWLWQQSQNPDYIESMRNGAEAAKEVHPDVYIALMQVLSKTDLELARRYARMALSKANVINDIQPYVYEFYVGYHLELDQVHKAAVWQGLYSAKDDQKANINAQYFRLHEKMNRRQLRKAQDEVDSLLFDAKWLNRKMSSFPKGLL